MKKTSHAQTLFPLEDTKQKKLRWLSHSGIEWINTCQKCFWLRYNKKIYQPQGIVSRLSNRFDIVLKSYFDGYRKKRKLPPMIEDQIGGKLEDPFQEKYFHKIDNEYGFWGKLDECIIDGNFYIPVDFKTTSSDPREKEIMDAYQHQIDEYTYLMEENKKKTPHYGYLLFFYPEFLEETHNGFPMAITIKKVEAHPERVLARIQKAIDILKNPLPKSSPECEYCKWYSDVKEYY